MFADCQSVFGIQHRDRATSTWVVTAQPLSRQKSSRAESWGRSRGTRGCRELPERMPTIAVRLAGYNLCLRPPSPPLSPTVLSGSYISGDLLRLLSLNDSVYMHPVAYPLNFVVVAYATRLFICARVGPHCFSVVAVRRTCAKTCAVGIGSRADALPCCEALC